jgi:hypothetical protein
MRGIWIARFEEDDETADRRTASSGKKTCFCTNHYLRTMRADLIMA